VLPPEQNAHARGVTDGRIGRDAFPGGVSKLFPRDRFIWRSDFPIQSDRQCVINLDLADSAHLCVISPLWSASVQT
jgi:hypothetical protein